MGTFALPAGPPAPYAPAPYAAPKPYAPPPPHKGYAPEKLPPQPFAYQYGVKDDYGTVQGEYRVALPDGRTQIVTYTADHANGYIADVKYEGQAVYPPEPKEGYGHPAPKYAPAPPKYPA